MLLELVDGIRYKNNRFINLVIFGSLIDILFSYLPCLKGALDKYNIIPQLFPKKLVFLYIRSVGMNNVCMLSFTF